jgi:hypothetical protein
LARPDAEGEPVPAGRLRRERLSGQRKRVPGVSLHDRGFIGLLNVAICRPGARADDYLTTVILDGLKAPVR